MELLLGLVLASHRPDILGPYHWHMSCERWRQRVVEIWADPHLPDEQKRFLTRYLRTKVAGECEL